MLLEPWELRSRLAPNRVLFGPHVTNLAEGRAIGARHVAYYERRARGGAGVIVTETASVHDSDWPYERAPLAADCGPGWRAVADAVHSHGALVIASLGHCGLQGSTTYSQGVLWAPSLVANVMTHEMPVAIDDEQIGELLVGTIEAARVAAESGCDGVELNVGQFSLWRQFLSGLTNQRTDRWADGISFVRETLDALRQEMGDRVLAVRFSADELAPWAGVTPASARGIIGALDGSIDYLVIERGSIYSEAATRPDMQAGETFNRELLRALSGSARAGVTVVAQGSIVSLAAAEGLVAEGLCRAVEMTRAQIADPDLVAKANGLLVGAVRPCVLCNHGCQVRDVRNPLVSCAVNPTAGYEGTESLLDDERPNSSLNGRQVRVVGAGPAGLEAARRSALRGATVTVRERANVIGGALMDAARLPGRTRWLELIRWYEAELARLGVEVALNDSADPSDAYDVVACGRELAVLELRDGNDGSLRVLDVLAALNNEDRLERVVVLDPVGSVVGVGVAEQLANAGSTVYLVTPDLVAGTQLSLTGDLVAANARLAGASVELLTHSVAVGIANAAVQIEDRYNGDVYELAVSAVVNAGFDLPTSKEWSGELIGDAVAPRTVHTAVLEGRRSALALIKVVRP